MKAVKGICKNLINTVIVCIMAAILFSVMTFCWLADTGNTFVMNFNSSTASAYFAGGNGSKNEPYKISTPVHMYNFAWLQYLGYFNLKDNFNNGRAQSFFELTGNIDMSSIAIPPIGTREYPFIGYFNGNGKTVYNVTVSNSEADFTRRPSTAQFQKSVLTMADSKFTDVDIVGLFGVTGDFNSFIANSYEKKDATGKKKTVLVNGVPTEIDVKNKDESSGTGTGTTTNNKLEPLPSGNTAENVVYYSGMNVNSMYIDKITVKSVSPKTLVGLAAGYISSTMQDVGVYRSKVSVRTDGGVSGITTVKGTVKTYGTTISEYSLVGDYDEENVGWTEVPTDGSGDSAAWGGSIDMRTLNRRLSYIMAKTGVIQGYSTNATDTNFRVNLYTGSNGEFYWNKNTLSGSGVMYLNENTLLPININKGKMGLDTFDVSTKEDDKGDIRLAYEEKNSKNNFRYNQYYKNYTVEEVASNNTGYIVGSAYSGDQGTIRSRIQSVAKGTYGGIYKSLGRTSNPESDDVYYEKEKFEMLTMVLGANGNYETYRIKDGVNGTATQTGLGDFVQKEYTDTTLSLTNKGAAYISVRKDFDETMSGSNMVHGFHFMEQLPAGFTSNNKSGYITTTEAKLYNDETKKLETISNYEFVKGGINFTVSEDGVIKTILGAYFGGEASQPKDSLFDLFKVERTSAGKVTKFTRIETIYKDQSGNLVYNPTDTTDLTLVFSFSQLTKQVLTHAAAYYFEIPVSSGDYVIGAYKDSSNDSNSNKKTAYLMYLDIGANGEGESGDTVELPYTMQSVDFVSVPTGFDDKNIIQTVKTTDSAGNETATYPAYKDVGFAVGVGSGTDTVYYKRKSYDSLPSGDGEIETAVYFWRLNKTINVSGFPSSYVGNGGNDDETNAKWD